jgi:hypothetical protein
MAVLILNRGTRWRLVVSPPPPDRFTPTEERSRYPLHRRHVGPQSRSDEERKEILPVTVSNPGPSGR